MKIETMYPELPEDIRIAISDINAFNNVLLAYLKGDAKGMKKNMATAYSIKINEKCQEIMGKE